MHEGDDLTRIGREPQHRVAHLVPGINRRDIGLDARCHRSQAVGETHPTSTRPPMVEQNVPRHSEQPHSRLLLVRRQGFHPPPGNQHDVGEKVGSVIPTNSTLEVVQNRVPIRDQRVGQAGFELIHSPEPLQSPCIAYPDSLYSPGARMPSERRCSVITSCTA